MPLLRVSSSISRVTFIRYAKIGQYSWGVPVFIDKVVPSLFEENLDKSQFSSAAAYAQETALQKAREVSNRAWTPNNIPHLVIGADTVVELQGSILEKPKDAANAEAMLSSLIGQRHAVHTGVAIIIPSVTGAF